MKNFSSKEIFLGEGRLHALKTMLSLCMALFFFAVPTFAQGPQNINIDVTDAPMSDVIRQIEGQSGYTFFYNNQDVDINRNVSLSLSGSDMTSVLNALFNGTGISWSIEETHVILSKDNTPAAKPDDGQLSGKVLDSAGIPVIGAVVMVEGSDNQAYVTDMDGMFYFPWSEKIASATLNVSMLGYTSQSVPVGGRAALTITLTEDVEMLESSVVTALGIKRSERAVSYNVQPLDADVFKTREANMVNSLQGKLAGVQINASSAGVGGETKVVMRGAKSISSDNNALYVLDGIPLPSLSLTSPGDSYSIYNGSAVSGDGISNFNPEDIANMSALVGPSAAALYGYKAANGVLMLTTRTGEEGVSVSYSTNTTFSNPLMLPDLQSTYGAKDGVYASWGSKLTSPQSWSVKDFFQTGYNTQHSLSLSIGGETRNTYLSAAIADAQGIIPNNDYRRYNFTINHTEDFLNNKLHLSLLTMYMNVKEQNMLSGGQYYNPLIPLYLMSPNDDINKYAVYERYDGTRNFKTQYWPWGSMNLQAQNPFWIINRNMFNNSKNRFIVGGSLKYDITDWLDVSGRVRIDYNNTPRYRHMPMYLQTSTRLSGTI